MVQQQSEEREKRSEWIGGGNVQCKCQSDDGQ